MNERKPRQYRVEGIFKYHIILSESLNTKLKSKVMSSFLQLDVWVIYIYAPIFLLLQVIKYSDQSNMGKGLVSWVYRLLFIIEGNWVGAWKQVNLLFYTDKKLTVKADQ